MPERFAIYFAPETSTPLWIRAAQWLGRDPSGATPPPAVIPGIDRASLGAVTISARRYGFHGTLKAPISLAAGTTRSELEAAVAAFAQAHRPVPIGRLVLRPIGAFLALVPEAQSAALTTFAGECVTHFDPFRSPPTTREREKRFATGLTQRQIELLDRYGYPYVLEEAQFHMTLADQMPEAQLAKVMAVAKDWFAPVLGQSLVLDRLSLFHEAEPGAPFTRLADFPLAAKVPA